MSDHYDIGDAPLATVTFADLAGAPADPATVTIRLLTPDGEVAVVASPDAAITNPSVGTWTYQLSALTQEGQHYLRAEGTGTLVAAVETTFRVRTSHIV